MCMHSIPFCVLLSNKLSPPKHPNLWLKRCYRSQTVRIMSIWGRVMQQNEHRCCHTPQNSHRSAMVGSHRLFWLKPCVTSVLLILAKTTGDSIFKVRLYFDNSGSISLILKRLYFIDPNGGLGVYHSEQDLHILGRCRKPPKLRNPYVIPYGVLRPFYANLRPFYGYGLVAVCTYVIST